MKRLLKWVVGMLLLAMLALAVLGAAWLQGPVNATGSVVSLVVPPGSGARQVAQLVGAVHAAPGRETAWWVLLRVSGKFRHVKAGEYEVDPGMRPLELLARLVNGDQALQQVTFVEGWTFKQVLAALQKEKRLTQSISRLSAENRLQTIMSAIGKPGVHPEGQFFPDTYRFASGQTDLDVLKRAAQAMDRQLAQAWAAKAPNSVLTSPHDALVLASIVEKETGSPTDRANISAVFHNRLRIGMRLQTDPTVIYGMGDAFDGNIRKRDLQTDTPYNTYTRAGLPPTPIAMPGKAALIAAVQPGATPAMYFVARGNGSSHFSVTLADHNRAVDRFIRGR